MSPKTSYYRGYMVEWECKQRLKNLGATHVIRSSRSLTPVDLIAFIPRSQEVWLIQVKAGKNLPRNHEKLREKYKDLVELKGNYKAKPILFTKKNGRYSFINLED